MRYIIIFLLLISGACYGQTTYYIRSDTVRIQKVGGNNELILENGTRARTGAYLKNITGGRTGFFYAVDSASISGTDLVLYRGGGTQNITLPVPGGATPTWQQTLTAGSTLTGNNTIAGGGFAFEMDNIGEYSINTASGSSFGQFYSNAQNTEISNSRLGGRTSLIRVNSDSIQIRPGSSNLFIDSLNYTLSAVGKKIMLRDTVTGLVQNIDPALLVVAGGGVTGSGTLNFVPKWTPNGTTLGNSQIYATTTSVTIPDSLRVSYSGAIPASPFDIINYGGISGATNTNPVGLSRLAYTGAFSMNILYNPLAGATRYFAKDTTLPLVYYEVGGEGLSLHGFPISGSTTNSNDVDDKMIWQARVYGLRESGNTGDTGRVWIQNFTGVYAENKIDPIYWSTSARNTTPFGYYRKEGVNTTAAWIYTSANGDANAQYQNWQKARGTLAAPASTQLNDVLYDVRGQAFGDVGYRDAAFIKFIANGNTTTSSSPGKISFGVTPAGSTTSTEAVNITSAGIETDRNFVFNTTAANTGFYFKINGSNRWILDYEDGESSGDAGSNLYLYRYHDNGSYGGMAFFVNRASGNVGVGTSTVPSTLTVNGLINMKNYTVATLPAGTMGDICYVTDALAPTFLATIVGGGAIVTPVFFNGTNWVGF